MNIMHTSSKPLAVERETTIIITQNDNGEWVAIIDTNIQKYATKCVKRGWKQTSETRCTIDDSWVAATFEAPARAISIRDANPPKREMSEEQKQAAKERFAAYREKKKQNE